jgi:hypothetical protein
MRYARVFAPLLLARTLMLHAQTPSPAHVVAGVVYDSIAHTPLAGAVVQATLVDSARRDIDSDRGRTFVAITDSSGHFRLIGLPNGRFAIGFQHDALNAFRMDSPLSAFELVADTSVAVDLAIPSGVVVRAQACANKADGSHDGLLAGFVLDARREVTMPGASIAVEWVELGLDHGKLRSTPHRVDTTVNEDGTYLACGVPSDGPVRMKVAKSGYRGIDAELTVPDDGVMRRDFHLADSGVVRGTGTLVGHIVQDDGRALASGLVSIPALALEVAVVRGEFSMTELPAGTWPLQTRAIGYEPQSILADASEHASTTIRIALTKKAQTLEAVNVVGKPGRDLKLLSEIQQRNLVANGALFLPGNSWLASAVAASDVLRGARGFTYKGPTNVEGRPWNGTAPCKSLETTIGGMKRGPRVVVIYVDGEKYPGGLETVNNAVPANQLLAVEAYPDVMSAPFLWRTNDACAVIAFWTKR